MTANKVFIVMPAYNAEKTLEKTYKDLPDQYKKNVILVDDKSQDKTTTLAQNLGLTVIKHAKNKGYGAGQKTGYKEALKRGAEIIVMIHPDYQYDSRLIDVLIKPIELKHLDIVLGNRIRTRQEALEGGMPKIKYLLNRILSFLENIILGVNLGEHLSGMRAYKKEVLKTLPIDSFSDDFVFDQQLIIFAIAKGYKIGDMPVPVRYFNESSSISFIPGAKFLSETFFTLFLYILYKFHIYETKIFKHSA